MKVSFSKQYIICWMNGKEPGRLHALRWQSYANSTLQAPLETKVSSYRGQGTKDCGYKDRYRLSCRDFLKIAFGLSLLYD